MVPWCAARVTQARWGITEAPLGIAAQQTRFRGDALAELEFDTICILDQGRWPSRALHQRFVTVQPQHIVGPLARLIREDEPQGTQIALLLTQVTTGSDAQRHADALTRIGVAVRSMTDQAHTRPVTERRKGTRSDGCQSTVARQIEAGSGRVKVWVLLAVTGVVPDTPVAEIYRACRLSTNSHSRVRPHQAAGVTA